MTKPKPILWTIAIVTLLPERKKFLDKLLEELHRQATPDVEILTLGDNRRRTTGSKRNLAIQMALGQYVSFFDDDDVPSSSFIERVRKEMLMSPEGPDVISFDVSLVGHPNVPNGKITKFGLDFAHEDRDDVFLRKPNHIAAWRKNKISDIRFIDSSFFEDTEWAGRASKCAQSHVHINELLYVYRHNAAGVTESFGRRKILVDRLADGKTKKVHLSATSVVKEGMVNVGQKTGPDIDMLADFSKTPWPLPDSSAHYVIAIDLLHTLSDKIQTMSELHRIMTPEAILSLSVPISPALDDKSFWNKDTFLHFIEGETHSQAQIRYAHHGKLAEFRLLGMQEVGDRMLVQLQAIKEF